MRATEGTAALTPPYGTPPAGSVRTLRDVINMRPPKVAFAPPHSTRHDCRGQGRLLCASSPRAHDT